jgi:hypothetical protein
MRFSTHNIKITFYYAVAGFLEEGGGRIVIYFETKYLFYPHYQNFDSRLKLLSFYN